MLSLRSLLRGLAWAQVAHAATVLDCHSLTLDDVPKGTSLINITSTERHDVTVIGTLFNSTGTVTNISFCDVQLYLTHDGADDEVRIALWLPLEDWNGRFMGTGGAGWNAGTFDPSLAEGVDLGFAAVATDAGVGLNNDPGPWANNDQLVRNFVGLSVHEMTVVGKTLTEKFYGRKPSYSYWHGCSQGGRQGYFEAQWYPDDYDGISAHAPAINWDQLLPGFLWPYLQQLLTPLPACKLTFITTASIAACDLLDGAVDGLIGHPPDCAFDARALVGTEVPECEIDEAVTEAQAVAWNKIRRGPETPDGKTFWHGMQPGSDLSFVTLSPFAPAESWLQDFVLREPDYDLSTLTYEKYLEAFNTSQQELGGLWGSYAPDLSDFKKRGGKLLTFHGWADQSIPGASTIEYWEDAVWAPHEPLTDILDFFRVFMAPGVGHCANFGYGPGPVSLVDTLVRWVEQGEAPDTLFATGFEHTRNLCHHPKKLAYKGSGDVKDADSWYCV